MSDWWWTPSRDANLLALGLARRTPPPVSTFYAINAKFAAFERTYLDLLELLKRDNKSIEALDALTYPSLSQTLDEYHDFKSDADTLRQGVESFSKRELGIPFLPYKVARYIYTDADIRQLNTKIDWQIRIMDGKMDDMVLSHFIHVHRRSQIIPSHDNHYSGSLTSTLGGSHNQRLTGLPRRQDDDDENIIHLWERVDHLSNRLIRTSPYVQSQIGSNETPLGFSPEEISRVIEPLKARFKKTVRSESALMFESITEDQLAAYSENRLKTLLSSFPDFTTRKRVYFQDELKAPRNIPKAKSAQSHALSPGSVATMEIMPPGMKFNLMTLDIVSFQRQTVIVCIDEYKKFGALHYLPHHSVIYPTTNTQRVGSSKHDTEAFLKEECRVQMTGSKNDSVRKALVMYNFPQKSDMFTFQCALRGKLIRHAFDVDKIESIRGLETTHQHLKIWSDFKSENYTLSFYVKKKTGHETYLEFPLECFVPNPSLSQDKNKPQLIRLYFRLQRPEPPKSKRSSRDSITTASSPPEAMNAKGRVSFSRNRLNSIETSPTQSMFKMFGKTRRPSKTRLSLPLPTGRIDQRSSSSFGSLETQSTDNTTAESAVSASSGLDSNIHPDAETMQYLDFKFSIITDVELFTTEFMSAINKTTKHNHFRGNSIYDESRHRVSVSLSEPAMVGKITTSPRTIDLGSQVVGELQELSLPPAMGSIPRSGKDLGISYGDESGLEGHSVSTQAFAFEDNQPATRDNLLNTKTMAPDLAYRVRGIPVNYQIDELKTFMTSKFDIDHSEMDVRSLATNPDGISQTAIVVFESVPSAISLKENNSFFRWKFIEGKNASHVQIDTHFNGLTMLYTPPKNAKHEIDICAVAVSDSAFEAFEALEGKETGGSYMWILDLLQDYFASARIMLYGCHANLSRNESSRVIENLARELIDSVNNLDDDGESQASDLTYDRARNVPLIFIGYSLAGQVIKQAMVIAAEQPEDDNFYQSVYGALFFGVPSSAMETSALETVMKDQAETFRDMSDPNQVQILNDKFNSVIERKDLHMQYFYETEKTIRLKEVSSNLHIACHNAPHSQFNHRQHLNCNQWETVGNTIFVVTPSSATNLLTSKQSMKPAKNVHSIQRDHLRLVKWKAHDPECPMVIRVMKTMKTKALAKHNGQLGILPSPDLLGKSRFQQPLRRSTGFPASPRMEIGFQQSSRTATGLASQRTIQSETARITGLVSTKDYHVGWICAVGPEYVAALQLLDERLSRPFDLSEDDENAYSFGIIGYHHVVIAGLAQGKYGLTSAASAATDMQRSFRSIRIGLMVGIAGGAPSKKHDIRLGDVVVSTPGGQRGGVFRYDSGRTIQNREFVTTGSLNSPPEFLLKALMKLSSLHRSDGHNIKLTVESMLERNHRLRNEYQKPDPDTDVLYESSFIHPNHDKSCAELCFPHKDRIVPRDRRDITEDDPVVHFGLIASGDQLMKDASVRDALAEKEEVLCFEMEAAGLMGRFPCLVIRGICDYSDTHKNDLWQGYAAATAAAYARELLLLALSGQKILEEGGVATPYEMEEDYS